MQANTPAQEERMGSLQIGIIVLTLATGLIHLVGLNLLLGNLSIPFTLNGLGYLTFLAALVLPVPILRANRQLVKYALMGFAAVTILAWIFIGRPYTTLGYITKLIELTLIALLFIDTRR